MIKNLLSYINPVVFISRRRKPPVYMQGINSVTELLLLCSANQVREKGRFYNQYRTSRCRMGRI